MKKKIIGAAIGNCVHILGIQHFLNLAKSLNYEVIFLGTQVSIDKIIEETIKLQPQIVALSYRLTPKVAKNLFSELSQKINIIQGNIPDFIFGGTPSVCRIADEFPVFRKVFSGLEDQNEVVNFLQNGKSEVTRKNYHNNLIERIKSLYPYPIIRHHFGLPNLKKTISGIKKISKAKVLDVISIGPDQNAQEFFFQQERMIAEKDGAGGVPVRTIKDLKLLYKASQYGNYPLMRIYAGTNDLQKWAEISVEAIHNAWGAIPLSWYSELDGRSERKLSQSIKENQNVIRWYAEKGIPVEINEPHQWSLRDAHDSLAVAMAFISAYNAKKFGVKDYIAQFMFNTPSGISLTNDLAKMFAKKEMIETLIDDKFKVYREVRTGINSLSSIQDFAKGQLAASIVNMLYLKPHILHVVGFSEGDHAILPEELIESCNIAHGVIHRSLNQLPEISDRKLDSYKKFLISEANILINAIRRLGNGQDDPLSNPMVLEKAIGCGLLDTPQFQNNSVGRGIIKTAIIDGGCFAVDPVSNAKLYESERTEMILNKIKN